MDWGPLLTTVGVIFSAIVGSFFTWLTTRPKNRADARGVDAQTELTGIAGFRILVEELQKERVLNAQMIEKQAGQIERQTDEIVKLRQEVASLRTDLDDVMTRWRRGETAPPPVHRRNRA